MKYTSVIGLEIHAELLTKSKVFCSCENGFSKDVNTRICPVCAALPGTLPSLNREAVRLAAKAGLATDCTVNNYSSFDRKNYFYPDLPKGYQITQFENPICSDGHITLGNGRNIRIERIHIEEDAGKLIHSSDTSHIDFNRCGVPLIEIVTMPDFTDSDEVCEFVGQLAMRLRYADVCDCKMEQGSLRVDVNISLMHKDSEELGTRAEIKNLNSLKSICHTIEYEIKRQAEILDKGEKVIRETRRFDDTSGTTVSMRSKEDTSDYRYFPEPDIPPVFISDAEIDEIRAQMPEMPHHRFLRYTEKYGLSTDDASILTASKDFSDFYDNAVKEYSDYRQIARLMLGELSRRLNESGKTEIPFSPKDLALLAKMTTDGVVSKNGANEILAIMFSTGRKPDEIAEENGFIMQSNADELAEVIDSVIAQNTNSVADYRNGNEKIFAYLMGQAMRAAGKGANPKLIRSLLEEKLK